MLQCSPVAVLIVCCLVKAALYGGVICASPWPYCNGLKNHIRSAHLYYLGGNLSLSFYEIGHLNVSNHPAAQHEPVLSAVNLLSECAQCIVVMPRPLVIPNLHW